MITVSVNNLKLNQKVKYPYIGVCYDSPSLIVVFTKPQTGWVLNRVEGLFWELFEHSTTWSQDRFTPLSGSITLTQ